MSDGLESLNAMRQKATGSRRSVPPPRHQPRRTPVAMPETAKTPTREEASSSATAPAPPQQRAGAAATGELAKVSVYLDETTDTYLETIRSAARSTRPRVDATRSAVVRLALNRLASQLSTQEVVAELRRSAASHSGPGRKRA